MFRSQRIRDPLHNIVEFEAGEFESVMWNVVCTRPYQRLRRVKQLGFSELVYPGASHTRFIHSVGVFHIARQLMGIVERVLGSEFRSRRAETALAAALVHDVGHGPFSHAFEDVGKRLNLKLAGNHEDISDLLIRESEISESLNQLGSGFSNDVADVIKRGPSDVYSAVVSSQFDADRLDYVQRDRLMAGSHHAEIDFAWLMSNLEIGEIESGVDDHSIGSTPTFVLGPKAKYAAEAYVLGLFQLYPTIYFHKATRGAEKLFSELLIRLVELVRDGNRKKTGLPKTHPIVRFANDPEAIENILALDDSVFWGALAMLSESSDILVSELATRLRDRNLFKVIDVRQRVSRLIAEKSKLGVLEHEKKVELSCLLIKERVQELVLQNGLHFIWDEMKREPYKRFDESKGPLNQIRIRSDDDKLVDLRTRSEVVSSIKAFKAERVYVREGDDESTLMVEKAIEEGVRNASSDA